MCSVYCRVENINFIDHSCSTNADGSIDNNDNTKNDDDHNDGNKKPKYELHAINKITNEILKITCNKLVIATDPSNAKSIIDNFYSTTTTTDDDDNHLNDNSSISSSSKDQVDVFKIPKGRGYVMPQYLL